MNTPLSSSVTLLSDPPIKAKLREDIVEGDPDSVYRDDVPVFHGLSVSGDVTGQVVYAGYGRKRDFEALKAKGERCHNHSSTDILNRRHRSHWQDCSREIWRQLPRAQDQR
jgi:hypothetical protein